MHLRILVEMRLNDSCTHAHEPCDLDYFTSANARGVKKVKSIDRMNNMCSYYDGRGVLSELRAREQLNLGRAKKLLPTS